MREIALHVLDILQNSVAGNATTVNTQISFDTNSGMLKIVIDDNGNGIDKEMLQVITDPFVTSRTTRKVGLGLPLYKFYAEQSGGSFAIESEKNVGTKVTAVFNARSIDCMPFGNIVDVMLTTISSNHKIRFLFEFSVDEKKFLFDTDEIKDVMDTQEGFCDLRIYFYLRDFIAKNINEINGGELQL